MLKTHKHILIIMPPKYNVVSELQNYMLSRLDVVVVVQKPIKPKQKDLFFSPGGDSLFWCLYVMKNGFCSYEMEPASFAKEKMEKIQYITRLRENKKVLKDHRIRKLPEIETSLSLDKHIDLNTFFALCALDNINADIVKPHTYCDIISNTEITNTFVIRQVGKRYKLEYEPTDISSLSYATSHFKLPLKSIGYYKLSNLHDICKQLQMVIPVECKKKQDIYALISNVINKID